MDYSGIGKRIKNYREKLKMTQQMLGEETDYSVQHISHIETGKTKLSVKCLLDIANALQVSVDELVCGYVASSSVIVDKEISDMMEDCSPPGKTDHPGNYQGSKRKFKKKPQYIKEEGRTMRNFLPLFFMKTDL